MTEPAPDNELTDIRRTVHFSGRVQGVFFRATTVSVAAPFRVTGFVRNLRDGRVELVAEGSRAEVDRFQDAVIDAMRRNIEHISAIDGAPTGEFSSFSVAY